jgi:hypothetical protein
VTDPLPPHVWFLVWRGRFRAIRREGTILVAKLFLLTIASGISGVLLAAFVHWTARVAVGLTGIGWSQWWFSQVRKQHTDYSMTMDEYWKRKSQQG